MNLTKTDLPNDVIETLRDLNIREVESLLSMLASPSGLLAIAQVLKMPVEGARELKTKLHNSFPDLETVPSAREFHPMGHIPPKSRRS